MKNFLFLILPFLLLSCAGSKVEIKPENSQSNEKQDTTLTLNEPRKLFTEPTYETDTDTVTIPKRTKQTSIPANYTRTDSHLQLWQSPFKV
jgi:hypothetical protein